jgi:hypothetical protein
MGQIVSGFAPRFGAAPVPERSGADFKLVLSRDIEVGSHYLMSTKSRDYNTAYFNFKKIMIKMIRVVVNGSPSTL